MTRELHIARSIVIALMVAWAAPGYAASARPAAPGSRGAEAAPADGPSTSPRQDLAAAATPKAPANNWWSGWFATKRAMEDAGGTLDALDTFDLSKIGLWRGLSVTAQPMYNYGNFLNGAGITLTPMLIGWLLVEYRRRCRAERALGDRLQEARTQLVTITHLDRRAAMGELTAAITHELNQPLEAILHNTEACELLLESGQASDEGIRDILGDIRRIALRAAGIIERLRGLFERREFETRPVDVNEVARDTAALLSPVASAAGVHIEVDLAIGLELVAGDRLHLQQVLLNVMLNGIEAMHETPHNRRRLVIQTARTPLAVEISVRDSGHGIPDAAVSQIFEPFYTTKGEGMGMGLSIGRTIVEVHGGRIAARNNADRGATVWFTLPASDAA